MRPSAKRKKKFPFPVRPTRKERGPGPGPQSYRNEKNDPRAKQGGKSSRPCEGRGGKEKKMKIRSPCSFLLFRKENVDRLPARGKKKKKKRGGKRDRITRPDGGGGEGTRGSQSCCCGFLIGGGRVLLWKGGGETLKSPLVPRRERKKEDR